MKECRDCMQVKPETEYYKHVNTKDRLSPHCKTCARAEMRKRYKRDVKRGAPVRKWARKSKPGGSGGV